MCQIETIIVRDRQPKKRRYRRSAWGVRVQTRHEGNKTNRSLLSSDGSIHPVFISIKFPCWRRCWRKELSSSELTAAWKQWSPFCIPRLFFVLLKKNSQNTPDTWMVSFYSCRILLHRYDWALPHRRCLAVANSAIFRFTCFILLCACVRSALKTSGPGWLTGQKSV